jgi:hypothetical protein
MGHLFRLFLLLLFFNHSKSLHAQVLGCKDPAASNFNPAATKTDGSCMYVTTTYVPPVKAPAMNSTLVENSGLQWAGEALWTFNDGGGQATIYKIDTLSNTILQTVHLSGAANIDWEDIAFDGTYFYIGDFGNNSNGARSDLKIYKFPIAAIPDHTLEPVVTVPSQKITVIGFRYADQPVPLAPTPSNATSFDCEAMIVNKGNIHLFTKDWVNKSTTHYTIPSVDAGNYTAMPTESFPINYLVTGADINSNGNVLVLLGYDNQGLAKHYLQVLTDYSNGLFFNGNNRKIELPDALVMGQGEGIAFRNDMYGYISNEKFERTVGGFTLTIDAKLRALDFSKFVPLYVLPIKIKEFDVKEISGSLRLHWQFEKKIEQLIIEYSTDGLQFNSIQKVSNTIEGQITHTPIGTLHFYRLKWTEDNGQTFYSKVIKHITNETVGIKGISIKTNGSLQFTITGNAPQLYGFKLSTHDGKLIEELQPQQFPSGRNRLNLHCALLSKAVVLLTAYNVNTSESWLLPVQ